MTRICCAVAWALPCILGAQTARRPLSESDIADITTLVMLEDNRRFDDAALARILKSSHPEVRRRAALSIGRIANPAGRALLIPARTDADTAVSATVVFATAQLYDTAAVSWLDSLLSRAATPPTMATEAARAFGMIRTPETRAALARYLSTATASPRTSSTIGEALLAIGRSARGDLAPIVRWTTATDAEIRWRAAWALFRPRDPAAVSHLLKLASDRDPVVRNWAIRGLTWPQVDTAGVDRNVVRARLRVLIGDPDRTVRTEAVRALATHPDSASVATIVGTLESDDQWITVSAAEGLATHKDQPGVIAPRLVASVRRPGSCARRSTALVALNALAPDLGFDPATVMSRDTSALCRTAAITFLRTKGEQARAPLTAMLNDAVPDVATAAKQAVDRLTDTTTQGRGGRGGGGGGGGGRGRGAIETGKTEADYRRIVETWVVPAYQGAPAPRIEWMTPRGAIEIEVYAGEVPLSAEYLMKVAPATLVGTAFTRVVPDFVDQQQPVAGAVVMRDEVNRQRLTRGNVSWATGGLDTGRPGYTLGHTPQPHNEGSFTSIGRVTRGMDAVDRIELGDRVTMVRVVR